MSPKEEKMRAIQASAAGRIIESADARQIGEAVLVTPTCARPLAKESKPTYTPRTRACSRPETNEGSTGAGLGKSLD
jgi:hypothetical protein